MQAYHRQTEAVKSILSTSTGSVGDVNLVRFTYLMIYCNITQQLRRQCNLMSVSAELLVYFRDDVIDMIHPLFKQCFILWFYIGH